MLFQSKTTVTVEVLDRNESPSFEGETTLSVPELSPVATVVGQITATDPDNNDDLTLKITSTSQEFSLSNTSCGKQVCCTGVNSSHYQLSTV